MRLHPAGYYRVAANVAGVGGVVCGSMESLQCSGVLLNHICSSVSFTLCLFLMVCIFHFIN